MKATITTTIVAITPATTYQSIPVCGEAILLKIVMLFRKLSDHQSFPFYPHDLVYQAQGMEYGHDGCFDVRLCPECA